MLIAAAAVACSCSVKEDRTPCPGLLEIGLDSCLAVTTGVRLDGWNASGDLFSCRSELSERGGNTERFAVPKGELGYCAWCGVERYGEDVRGLRYEIPTGRQAEPLWACARTGLLMQGERLRSEAALHRQHCLLTLRLSGFQDARLPGLLVTVGSGTSGMDLRDLSPIAGTFRVSGSPDAEGAISFLIPRQGYGDLRAEVYDEGRLSSSADLSAALDTMGYDWTAEDLGDITLTLTASSSGGGLVIGPWDDGGSVDGSTSEQITHM